MKLLITEENSFIGKNLIKNLENLRDGKNRTRPNISIDSINDDYNSDIAVIMPDTNVPEILAGLNKGTKIIFICELGGSIYENNVQEFDKEALIFRLPQIVGKWQDPTDGIVASYCSAVANDEPYDKDNVSEIIEVIFIDDLLEVIYDALEGKVLRCDFPRAGVRSSDPTADYDGKTPVITPTGRYCYSNKTIRASLGTIIEKLEAFNKLNSTFIVPEMPQGTLDHRLFSMYLSYLPRRKMSYPLKMNIDNRGAFTELVKTMNNGQVSINIARPGNIRGQHWHNNKWEIFIVVSGHGLIQERKIGTDEVFNFEVRGEEMRAVIMLPGYSHNIINLEKDKDLVTVMFANEQFDPGYPDTFFEIVDKDL